PRRIAQFERIADAARQLVEKLLEPLDVHLPPRRQLPEDRPELVPQPLRARDEVRDPAPGILQLDHVREKAAALDGVDEIVRYRLAPGVKLRFSWQAVE